MREFINCFSLALILNVIMSGLLMILSEMNKQPFPPGFYVAIGALSSLYSFSRKENWP